MAHHTSNLSNMAKITFNRPFDYSGSLPDVDYPPSPTVPDMSLSISEILRRYVNNEPIPQDIIGQPHYNAGVLSPMSRKGVDLADWSDLMSNAKSVMNEAVTQAKREEQRRESLKKQTQEQAVKTPDPPSATAE